MIIFTGRYLTPLAFMGARGAHKWHQEYIYSYHRVQKSYQLFEKPLILSSIIFTWYPFQPLSISLLRLGNTFSISPLFNVTFKKIVLMSHRMAAFHSQCQWIRIFLSLTNHMEMGTQL